MGYPIEIKENNAAATLNFAPVSRKKSTIIARRINGMPVSKAKTFLQGMVNETQNIEGKHHTKTAQAVLELVENAERNAKNKELGESLIIKTITAEKGPKRLRRKRLGGRLLKISHLKIVLEDTDYKPKEAKDEKVKEEKPEPKEDSKPADKEVKEKPKAEKKTEKKEAPKKAEDEKAAEPEEGKEAKK